MNVYLKNTIMDRFVHHLYNGEQIVRNPKLNALIETKLTSLDPMHRRILATPQFRGSFGKEQIDWYTDQFTSVPKSLSSLSGESYAHYKALLDQIMAQFAEAIQTQPESIRKLFEEAVTYHSLDNVFCADDKIVLTEWGMHLKGQGKWVNLIGVDYDGEEKPTPMDGPEEEEAPPVVPPVVPPVTPPKTDSHVNVIGEPQAPPKVEPKAEEPKHEAPRYQEAKATEDKQTPPPPPHNYERARGRDESGKGGCRKWLLWLLALLLLLLLLALLFMCTRSCKEPVKDNPLSGIPVVPPDIDPEKDIVISDDSLTMEVNNRVILLIKDGGTVPEFVTEFRKLYPDEDRYKFANPDTILPRIILIMPTHERKDFIDNLRDRFPKWDLVVIPETLYRGSATSVNDPDLADKTKRWYFEMCSVFDAWDVTMGDSSITVAVVDGDMDLSHPELQGKIVKPYNAVYHNSDLYVAEFGHGMHVAATAAGNANNEQGTAGVAPKVKVMPIQVDDRKGLIVMSAVIDGILYAIQNGADVVNLSLGTQFDPSVQYLPEAIQKNMIANNFLEEEAFYKELFDYGDAHNVTFVIAGGNDNILIGMDAMGRCSKTLKVSAVQPDKHKAIFSNYGSYSTVSAPGVQIYNALPGNKYDYLDGTSMAAPIVTGAVALMKSVNKSLSSREIIEILQRTGTPSPSDVGPIINLAAALAAAGGTASGSPAEGTKPGEGTDPIAAPVPGDGSTTDCGKYQNRYNELLEELEKLKREHPECIAEPDTMKIPEDATVSDISGTWRSTTRVLNTLEQEIVIYLSFNGTTHGSIIFENPDGKQFTAATKVNVKDDKVYIEQLTSATNPKTKDTYTLHNFVLRPGKDRNAEGSGYQVAQPAQKVRFKLIRLNR